MASVQDTYITEILLTAVILSLALLKLRRNGFHASRYWACACEPSGDDLVHTECDQECEPSGDDPSLVLNKQGRKLFSIGSDGNCMFRALAFLFYGHETAHLKLRSLLMKFILLNHCCFQPLIFTVSFNEHIAAISVETGSGHPGHVLSGSDPV